MKNNLRIKLISSFFTELNLLTEYVVLHHIEKIYDVDDDIDFLVNIDLQEMLLFIKKFTKSNNLCLLNYYMIDVGTYRFDIVYYNDNSLEKIELDCACKSKGNDLLSIQSSLLLKNRILVNINKSEFYKVSNENEIESYIKKKAYKNTDILSYSNYFKSLNNEITEKVIIDQYTRWDKYFKSNLFKIKFKINKIYLLTERLFHKQSLTISFLGPDGSGKSTVINKINKYPLYINNYYFHLKPIITKKSSDDMVTDPHGYALYSPLKSYIKLMYFICQYSFGWIKNICRLKIKSSLIIFDRYFDDMLVDNRRYRYGGSIVVAKIARFFIPKPDLYFILTTDAKVIYERKQEVPFKELERQIEGYRALADEKRYFNIDVNCTPEEIVKEITKIIMKYKNNEIKES